MRRSRKPSLNLSRDHKSTSSHLDVRSAQRLLLTSTKGLQSQGVAKLTERGATLHKVTLLPFQPLSLPLLCLLSVLFPHFNNNALPTVAWGVAGQKKKITPYYQICRGGWGEECYSDSIRGNMRLWAALHSCASPGMKKQRRAHLGEWCVEWDHPFSDWACNSIFRCIRGKTWKQDKVKKIIKMHA